MKIFQCCIFLLLLVGYYVPMGAVIGLAFIDCSQPYIGVVLLTIALGFKYEYFIRDMKAMKNSLNASNHLADSFGLVVLSSTSTTSLAATLASSSESVSL